MSLQILGMSVGVFIGGFGLISSASHEQRDKVGTAEVHRKNLRLCAELVRTLEEQDI